MNLIEKQNLAGLGILLIVKGKENEAEKMTQNFFV